MHSSMQIDLALMRVAEEQMPFFSELLGLRTFFAATPALKQ